VLQADQIYRGSPGLAYGRQAISGIVAGRTLRVKLRPKVKAALVRAVLTVKTNRSDTDVNAKLKYTIDVTAQSWGQLTAAGSASTRATCEFVLSPSATKLLGGLPLYWEAAGIYADGEETPIEAGPFYLTDWTADAVDAGNVNYIDLAPGASNVMVGATVQLTATPRDSGGTALPGRTVDYFVSDEDLASVDVNGLVTVKAAGTIYVFARSGGVASYMTITASSDDVGLLVGNLGGDAQVIGFYDTRRNVRVRSDGGVGLWEDARIPIGVTSGYFFGQDGMSISFGNYAGLDAQTKVTLMLWYQGHMTGWKALGMGATKWFIADGAGGNTIALAFASGTILAQIPHPGMHVPYKVTFVYDGTQATNATKLIAYLSTFDRATRVWSADVAQTVTFTGTIPTTWPVAGAANLLVGGDATDGWCATGICDEIRIWSGANLTLGQVGAETLAASPAAPNLRYPFANGSLLNVGSTVGYNGTISGPVVVASCNHSYGPPLWAFSDTIAPAWNAGTLEITPNDSTDYLQSHEQGALLNLGRTFGWSVVATMPIYDGSSTDGIASVRQSGAGRTLLAANVQGAATTAAFSAKNSSGGTTLTTGQAVGSAVRRVMHARRTVTGGSNDQLTIYQRMGSLAEVASTTDTMTVFDDPAFVIVGRENTADSSYADMAIRALILKKTMVAADQVFINAWANTASIHNAAVT
jgi:hypothetical protein